MYELLATGSTTTSWPDHLFTCVQINTAGHSFTATSPQHTRTTAARLFVQSPCCLFRRLLTFYFFAVCTLNVEIGDEKEKQGEDPQCAGIETRVHPHQAISRSEIEHGDPVKTVRSIGSVGSLKTSLNFFLPSLFCHLVFLPLIFGRHLPLFFLSGPCSSSTDPLVFLLRNQPINVQSLN